MTNPTMKPCPTCKTAEHLAVFKYDHGWQHVECEKCHLLGPGEGAVRQAIRSYNQQCAAVAAA